MSDSEGYRNPADGIIYYYTGDQEPQCEIGKCPIEYSVYGYRPSLAFTGTIIALYALVMVVQTFLGIRYRKWGFMVAMQLGCLCEILGYVGRILYYQNPWAQGGFIMQIVLITIAPVFFSAAIYVLIYQIAKYVSAESSRVNPKLFYYIFITADIISLILQAVGGAMSSTSEGDSSSGVNIALAGLAFQVATLVFFAVAVLDYMFCSRKVWSTVKLPTRFISFCAFLALAWTVITIRCCYRVYELSEGYSRDSEALRDQPLFNGLEGVMIILAAIFLIGGHPGFVFREGETLTQQESFKGKSEREASAGSETV
jgi:hypothetical protein